VSVILSTDMCQHFSLLDVWRAKAAAAPDIWAWHDRTLLLVMTMHLSDIVNPARPAEIAMKWGSLIVDECMAQVREPRSARAAWRVTREVARSIVSFSNL
jgi:3'5'-cyclic nucleotide phosphodiesterase